MKALLLEIPDAIQQWMQERARLGHDRHDEMWDGVLHMVPPPSSGHQERGSWLIEILGPLARARSQRATYETGVFRPGRNDDYRQPDVVVYTPDQVSRRGVEGRAELVIEIRSPNDESWEKLRFFAEMGIPEVLIIDGDEPVLLRLNTPIDVDQFGSYARVEADADGWVSVDAVPVALRTNPTGGLAVRSPTETVII